MNKISLLAFAILASVSPAFGQSKMMGKKPTIGHASGKMDPMMGLTPAERKVAMAHMSKMTAMEMGAHKHFMEQAMMGKSDKAAMMALGKSDQVTLKGMMAKMTPMEKKVAMKMSAHARMMAKKPMPMKSKM